MSPVDLLPPDSTMATSLALVLGGALVGAVLARVVTRRQADAQRGREARAHGLRVRQLEAGRREAIVELGRVAAELAQRALEEGRKAPRRAAVTPELGAAPAALLQLALYAARERELVLSADWGADGPQEPVPHEPSDGANPPLAIATTPSRVESWSVPIVPLPRRSLTDRT
jgi:hypothetical protein